MGREEEKSDQRNQFSETSDDLKKMRDAANLVVASQLFQCPERREAFNILYALMRKVDDLVDSVSESNFMSSAEYEQIRSEVVRWERAVISFYEGIHDESGQLDSVVTSLEKFHIPKVLWDNFFESMWFDFHKKEIHTFNDFLQYAEGASVAATTIYLMLIGAVKTENGFDTNNFDYIETGRNLGIWAYCIHIARDLKSDLLVGNEGRLTIPKILAQQFDFDKAKLRATANTTESDSGINNLVKSFLDWSRSYGDSGKKMASVIGQSLPLDRQIILCLIVAMYNKIQKKIEESGYHVLGQSHIVSPEERQNLCFQITMSRSWEEMKKYWI